MGHSNKKIFISELHEGFIERFVLWVHSLLGYEVLLFCITNNQIKLTQYQCNDYSSLRNYDFSIFFHRKAEWSEKLFNEVCSNKEVNIENDIESKKLIILIKDIFQRSLGRFDELMYLAELKKQEFDKVKIRCRWGLIKSQTLKKCIENNDIFVSFAFLPNLSIVIKKVINVGSLKKILNFFSLKLKPKSASEKKISKVIFFPHKGVAYGNSFEKDYYYSDEVLSPLNRKNILHLEYGAFESEIAKSYLQKNLEFDFIKKPKATDIIKYFIINKFLNSNNKNQSVVWKKVFNKTTLLSLYTNLLSEFLVEFYLKELSSISGCKVALIGYDALLPKEIALALHKLNIVTIAVQERYTLPHAGNYNVVVDNYLVWGYQSEKMIDESIGESFVGRYVITGPPRSDKINRSNSKLSESYRKKFVVYSNAPEPNIYINNNVLLNNWVNIHALFEDILELADKFTECDFIIRAKHANWSKINYFTKILEALNQKKNIEIEDNYDNFDISYTLLSDVYAVIGHHTSIADEAMCYRIPVLFHDFGPYAESIYAQNYNYNNLDIFSKSSADFQSKFFNYFIKDQYPKEFQSYVEKTFGELNDGAALKRIGSSLKEIVGEI
tara:strand:- start:2690 stop:4522 length:1833 start_codon:yes stop_codon:yes gene_type:complete